MRVIQYIAPGKPAVVNIPIPKPVEREVLVRVEGVTTCPQWDLHIMDGTPMFESRPLAYPYTAGEPGHEFVGFVEAIGDGVPDFLPGTRVAAWRDPGGRRQGCYAEYVSVDAEHLLAVPEDLAVESIAPLELAMCVQVSFDQLLSTGAVAGKTVAISGLGPAGLIAVQMAKAYGAGSIIAIEPNAFRRTLGRSLGADHVYAPGATHDREIQIDTGLDTTGLKPVIENLISLARSTVAIFGVLREAVSFSPDKWWGDFKLMGYGEHNRAAAVRALDLVRSEKLDLSQLVSTRCTFESYGDAVESLRRQEAIKVLVCP